MLNKELQEIFDKYNKDNNWLSGNFILPEEKEKHRIMFIGQKPSDYFIKNPSLRYLGNYNATFVDMGFQCSLRKHKLRKVYVTDMVKTEGKAGVDFEKEWNSDNNFKKCLKEEIEYYKPQLIVLMSKKVEKLFNKSFKELDIPEIYYPFYHPVYLCMNPHATSKWDKQFEELNKIINK